MANLPTADEVMGLFRAVQRAQTSDGKPMFDATDVGRLLDFLRDRPLAPGVFSSVSPAKLGVLMGAFDVLLRGPSQGWCCKMREKFLIGCVGENDSVPEPVDVADFIDFDAKAPSGRPVMLTKFCPFCGRRILPGQLRVFEDGSGGG